MSALLPIATEIDLETFALVDRVAQRRGISSRAFAAEAIRRAAETDDDFHAFVQVGIDAIERGEVISHEEMMTAHRARCA